MATISIGDSLAISGKETEKREGREREKHAAVLQQHSKIYGCQTGQKEAGVREARSKTQRPAASLG